MEIRVKDILLSSGYYLRQAATARYILHVVCSFFLETSSKYSLNFSSIGILDPFLWKYFEHFEVFHLAFGGFLIPACFTEGGVIHYAPIPITCDNRSLFMSTVLILLFTKKEREIRSLCEASVTSDGMLSCYTPFLLAIAKCRAAESGDNTSVRPSDRDIEGVGAAGNHARCPPSLCAEALWALSEYAVLSPGLAATEVLPLAETLVRNTAENPQVIIINAWNPPHTHVRITTTK